MALPHQRFGDPICSTDMGTKIFAILNLIVAIGFSVCCTVGMAYIRQILAEVESGKTHDGSLIDKKTTFDLLYLVMLMLSITFMSYISLVCAALLVYGFFKKIAGYLKAYLWYGVFVELMSAVAVVVAFIPDSSGGFTIPVSVSGGAIALLIIYALILAMIRITYTKFVDLQMQYNPQVLKTTDGKDSLFKD